MPILTNEHLRAAVRLLRKRGVRFPHDYPPRNLDPGSVPFRGTISEVETVLLLNRVIDPTLLELAEPEVGKDSDVIVQLFASYRLQVKVPLSLNVRGHVGVSQLFRFVRMDGL